jgi:hypothetical protein
VRLRDRPGFAIATHPRIFAPPTPSAKAIDQIDARVEPPTLTLLAGSNAHPRVPREEDRPQRVWRSPSARDLLAERAGAGRSALALDLTHLRGAGAARSVPFGYARFG